MAYHYSQVSSQEQLEQISQLQVDNLKRSLTPPEIAKEGFVTCEHSIDLLHKMNHPDGHIIAVEDDQVAGYCLVMSPLWRTEIEVLKPMFEMVDEIASRHDQLTVTNYIVMGQVCIGKSHRQQGVFKGMYHHFRKCLSHKYAFCITEIATENTRSLSAHEAVGFKVLHSYIATDGRSWELVIWDWR